MSKPTLAESIAVIREAVIGIDGAEVNICEDRISFMHGTEDKEYRLSTAKDLVRVTKAIKVLEEYI